MTTRKEKEGKENMANLHHMVSVRKVLHRTTLLPSRASIFIKIRWCYRKQYRKTEYEHTEM